MCTSWRSPSDPRGRRRCSGPYRISTAFSVILLRLVSDSQSGSDRHTPMKKRGGGQRRVKEEKVLVVRHRDNQPRLLVQPPWTLPTFCRNQLSSPSHTPDNHCAASERAAYSCSFMLGPAEACGDWSLSQSTDHGVNGGDGKIIRLWVVFSLFT